MSQEFISPENVSGMQTFAASALEFPKAFYNRLQFVVVPLAASLVAGKELSSDELDQLFIEGKMEAYSEQFHDLVKDEVDAGRILPTDVDNPVKIRELAEKLARRIPTTAEGATA